MSTWCRTRRARVRGYTAVEVLSAMTLFAIGAAGVIGMQRVTVQGGEDARRFDMATNIANEWTARLQRDAMFWTMPNASNPLVSNIDDTRFIKQVATCSTNWCLPGTTLPSAGSEPGMSPAFDSFGRDRPQNSGDHMYCVQYRLQWIAPPGPANNPSLTAIMRAEVRVFWARLELNTINNCAAPAIDPDGADGPKSYHFIHATTAVRENAAR